MKITEFAQKHCPALLRPVSAQSLYEKIKEQDNFYYDAIRVTEDGVLTKVVYIDDNDRFIDIYELMSYSEEDAEATKDIDFIQVYKNYMSRLNTEDMNVADTLRLAREWRELREREGNSAHLLS